MKTEKPEKYLFEEYHEIPDTWSWAILLGLVLFLILTPIAIHRFLPDRERDWQYGALGQIPGESIYSTIPPVPVQVAPADTDRVPRQIEPRPGARPLTRLKPLGYEREGQ